MVGGDDSLYLKFWTYNVRKISSPSQPNLTHAAIARSFCDS